MTDRILDFAEEPVRLCVRLDNLVIERKDKDSVRIPLSEIAAVVASNPMISMSLAAISGIASHGGILVVCDGKYTPSGMMLPLVSHSLQSERFSKQIGRSSGKTAARSSRRRSGA